MTDLTNILGIALIGVGAASAVYGTILCYSVKVRENKTEYLLDEELGQKKTKEEDNYRI